MQPQNSEQAGDGETNVFAVDGDLLDLLFDDMDQENLVGTANVFSFDERDDVVSPCGSFSSANTKNSDTESGYGSGVFCADPVSGEGTFFPSDDSMYSSGNSDTDSAVSAKPAQSSKRKRIPQQPQDAVTKRRSTSQAVLKRESKVEQKPLPVVPTAPISAAEGRRRKQEEKKARNRQLAAESRERRKEKMKTLEVENKQLRERVEELEIEIKVMKHEAAEKERKLVEQQQANGKQTKTCTVVRGTKMGAGAMAVTMCLALCTDTTDEASISTNSGMSLTSFGAVGWELLNGVVSLETLLGHILALSVGVFLTVALLCAYYLQVVHRGKPKFKFNSSKSARKQQPLLPTEEKRKPTSADLYRISF
mmetsp:Transcript_6079/g.9501  ORF Transcript_6079/g.9501 Transcript_6079/m.9501 type:complete len:365 (+) Transcript_6079:314-1408(+)